MGLQADWRVRTPECASKYGTVFLMIAIEIYKNNTGTTVQSSAGKQAKLFCARHLGVAKMIAKYSATMAKKPSQHRETPLSSDTPAHHDFLELCAGSDGVPLQLARSKAKYSRGTAFSSKGHSVPVMARGHSNWGYYVPCLSVCSQSYPTHEAPGPFPAVNSSEQQHIVIAVAFCSGTEIEQGSVTNIIPYVEFQVRDRLALGLTVNATSPSCCGNSECSCVRSSVHDALLSEMTLLLAFLLSGFGCERI
jgi:hypothetical protein